MLWCCASSKLGALLCTASDVYNLKPMTHMKQPRDMPERHLTRELEYNAHSTPVGFEALVDLPACVQHCHAVQVSAGTARSGRGVGHLRSTQGRCSVYEM
jgi:hypothetical protein